MIYARAPLLKQNPITSCTLVVVYKGSASILMSLCYLIMAFLWKSGTKIIDKVLKHLLEEEDSGDYSPDNTDHHCYCHRDVLPSILNGVCNNFTQERAIKKNFHCQ